MVYRSFKHILTFFLDFFTIMGVTNGDKDLEITFCVNRCVSYNAK